jgi:hypothetical protein
MNTTKEYGYNARKMTGFFIISYLFTALVRRMNVLWEER